MRAAGARCHDDRGLGRAGRGAALALDSLARMASRVVELGGTVRPLPDTDLALLPDLGSGFNDVLLWQHQEARPRRAGGALDNGRATA